MSRECAGAGETSNGFSVRASAVLASRVSPVRAGSSDWNSKPPSAPEVVVIDSPGIPFCTCSVPSTRAPAMGLPDASTTLPLSVSTAHQLDRLEREFGDVRGNLCFGDGLLSQREERPGRHPGIDSQADGPGQHMILELTILIAVSDIHLVLAADHYTRTRDWPVGAPLANRAADVNRPFELDLEPSLLVRHHLCHRSLDRAVRRSRSRGHHEEH